MRKDASRSHCSSGGRRKARRCAPAAGSGMRGKGVRVAPGPVRCSTGKIRYRGRKAAKSAMKDHAQSPAGKSGVLGEYLCEHCDGWHLGHARYPYKRRIEDDGES